MLHVIPKLKGWGYSDFLIGGHKKIKGPTHMVEGGHHLRKAPNPNPLWSQEGLPSFQDSKREREHIPEKNQKGVINYWSS